MSFSITAVVITDEAKRVLRELPSSTLQVAVKAGVKQGSKTATVQTKKAIRQRYAVKSGGLDKASVRVIPTSHGGFPAAELKGSRNTRTVNRWGARETRRGLTFSIYKGKRETLKTGFMAKGLPFYRTSSSRYPIEVAHGPSVDGMFGKGAYADEMRDQIKDSVEPAVEKGINRSIRGWAARNNLL